MDALAPLTTALADRYRVERELGVGGMATVYLAQDLKHERQVAIKVLHPDLAATIGGERFLNEIRISAQLQHPHILGLIDSGRVPAGDSDNGRAGGLLYFVMPYVQGDSLRTRLARAGELPVNEAVRLLREIASALAYAHGRGVVHRDIKPDNVMLSGDVAMVTDFGVAKALSTSMHADHGGATSLGMALGTPAYMAPEQVSADPAVDHRADIYAFGVLAYEVLTGQAPFAGRTVAGLMAAHVTETPENVGDRRRGLPHSLGALVMRCLEKRPADRPQNADEIVRVLDGVSTTYSGSLASSIGENGRNREPPESQQPLRIATLFALASGVVMVSTYALVQGLGLPDWVMLAAAVLLAIGFPIVMATGHHERRRTEARETGAIGPVSLGVRRHLTWRKSILGGGLAFTALVVAASVFMGMRTLGIGPAKTLMSSGALKEGSTIVLADFVDRTDRGALSTTVTEALRVDLVQSPALHVMQTRQVRDALQRMQRPPNAPLSPDAAREVAVREGAAAVVSGEIAPLGAGVVITAQVMSAETGDVLLAQRETAADSTALIGAIDRLSANLRERIGESLRTIRASAPLARATTGSLPALRLYSAGLRARDTGNVALAIRQLREATALDSTFAEAYRSLAVQLSNSGLSRREVIDAVTRAYRHRDRLPDVTGRLVEASYSDFATRDQRAALVAYQRVLDLDPTNGTALNNSAVKYWELREPEAYRAMAVRAARSDMRFALYRFHDVTSLVLLGRLDSAATALARLDSVAPGHFWAAYAGAFLGYQRRDFDEVRRRARTLAPDAHFFLGSRPIVVASADAAEGRLAEAIRELGRAIANARSSGDHSEVLALTASLATATAEIRGDARAALEMLSTPVVRNALDSLDGLSRPYESLAIALARAGGLAEARRLLAEMEVQAPDTLLGYYGEFEREWARGSLALAEGDVPAAITHLRRSAEGPCDICALPDLARAYDVSRSTDSALVVYERYANALSIYRVRIDQFGLARALRRLGELYEDRGDRRKALLYYEQFVALYQNADPELQPLVADVKGRIAKLMRRVG